MRNKIGAAIAAILLMGCATPSGGEVITGFTVNMGQACWVDDLSTESMDLLTLWWSLNKKKDDGTITEEEYNHGFSLEQSGLCGRLVGGIPVTIVLSDGTIYLLQFPDGSLAAVTDGAFTETTPPVVDGKEFRIDKD